jgi:hypothetical protein
MLLLLLSRAIVMHKGENSDVTMQKMMARSRQQDDDFLNWFLGVSAIFPTAFLSTRSLSLFYTF